MNEDELQRAIKVSLDETFANVALNEFGTIMVPLPGNPIGCKTARLADQSLIVNLEAPVLFDVPTPPASLYELICLMSTDLGYGSFLVIGGPNRDIHIFLRAQLLPEEACGPAIHRAVVLLHEASIREIRRFRSLTPPIGGATAQ
ncbi:hypothetical protein GAR05_03564 [Micromonospora saelicesensis]|uniref:Uncharacterized protein n=1 Tax=Micromonospora saelicesensis TaxID=285676 RepID=A0A328P015_9ACTN|nr:hypothetical protein [Micromonospora saelicesensis]RAN97444.1 hypothetical protein GAR05_03564 [Micromonospora saelicesensis]RAO37600.1 hypothetical protein PSN13_01595 [Micromonospora saelicesensis]